MLSWDLIFVRTTKLKASSSLKSLSLSQHPRVYLLVYSYHLFRTTSLAFLALVFRQPTSGWIS